MNDCDAHKILRLSASSEEEAERLPTSVAATPTAYSVVGGHAPAAIRQSATALIVNPLMAIALHAQSAESRPTDSQPDTRAGAASVEGRPVRLRGVPTVSIPAWAWGMALAATIGGTVGLTRYFAYRRMREQLIRLKEERRVDQERLRIARDFHDTLAEGFTGVILQLEAAADAQSRGLAQEIAVHFKRANDLARDGLEEARRSVRSLRQQPLEQKRLPEALDALLEKMTAGAGLQAKLIVDGAPRRLASVVEQNLLCIGQEALANALRHARASRFTARLIFAKETVRLSFQDDGRGFDQTAAHDGFGLIGMKERAQAIGGELSIQSTTMGGTTISIALPIPGDGQPGEPR